MYCKYCGNRINSADEYCNKCGNKLNEEKTVTKQSNYLVSFDSKGIKNTIIKHKEALLCISVVLIVIIGIIIISGSCSNRVQNNIIGKWSTQDGGFTYTIYFRTDNTFLYIHNNGTSGPYNYTFSGNDLIINYNEYASVKYKFNYDAKTTESYRNVDGLWYMEGDVLYFWGKTFYKQNSNS